MLFNSIQFVVFFVFVTPLYFALPFRYRWMLLLFASCIFYMAFIPAYILILVFTIAIDYIAGIVIENSAGARRKQFLIISILSNVGILFVFKYFNFFNANLSRLATLFHWHYPIHALSIILPIGLSFHTFQAMSYTIEVYKGKQKAERRFGIYALYVMFYPQLVAGPIERPQNLIPQFYKEYSFDYQRVTDGLKLIVWGLFKKIVVADRLARVVNTVYNNPEHYRGVPLIIATVFFAYQIYCDFSGYSDVAVGAAQVMGFKIMNNFHRPYFSKSISEFWRRWHISLSTWFRDYVYIPMGGNRVPRMRWYFNLFITFLISGLWHGANWTFVAWGALHGSYLIVSNLTQGLRARFIQGIHLEKVPVLYELVQVSTTFCLVCFAWIFFRANTVSDAFYIASHLFVGVKPVFVNMLNIHAMRVILASFHLTLYDFLLSVSLIGFIEFVHMVQRKGSVRIMLSQKPVWFRWVVYILLVLAIFNMGITDEIPFIYFQF